MAQTYNIDELNTVVNKMIRADRTRIIAIINNNRSLFTRRNYADDIIEEINDV